MGVGLDGVVGRDVRPDADHGPPLAEPRTQPAVLGEALAQAVKPFGDLLARGAGEPLCATVDLDPGDDAPPRQEVRQRRAVIGCLADRLVEENDATDERLDAGRREQQVAVGAPSGLGGLDAHGAQALLDRAGRLVSGQDPLAGRHERLGYGLHARRKDVHQTPVSR